MVLDILEDIDIPPPDRFQNFSLYLSIGEPGVPDIDLESGRAIVICRARKKQHASVAIICKIYFSYDKFRGNVVAACDCLGFSFESPLVDSSQFFDHLIGEHFCSGTCDNAQMGRVGVAHATPSIKKRNIVECKLKLGFSHYNLNETICIDWDEQFCAPLRALGIYQLEGAALESV